MLQVLQVLSHPFCMQNKQAYTPEVVCRIIWAIIMDTQSFFNDIKLAEDFLEQGHYMQFPSSTLEGNLMSIKHGIKLQRHNFPHEWTAPDNQPRPQYYPGKWGWRLSHSPQCPQWSSEPMDQASSTGPTKYTTRPLWPSG
jgi:hypothetical protein